MLLQRRRRQTENNSENGKRTKRLMKIDNSKDDCNFRLSVVHGFGQRHKEYDWKFKTVTAEIRRGES